MLRFLLCAAAMACLLPLSVTEAVAGDGMRAIRRLENGQSGVYAPAKAGRLYCTAARAGNADAAFALGRLYLSGRGVRKNAAMGAAWLKRAAALGRKDAAALVPEVGSRLPKPACRGIEDYVREVAPPPEVALLVKEAAERYDIDPAFILTIMQIESTYDPRARSPKGAMGLMQLMPMTAKRFGVADPYDPAENIMGGSAYLRLLIDRYDGEVALVAAAYNAGEHAVDRYGGIPPFPETIGYVAAVRTLYPETSLN